MCSVVSLSSCLRARPPGQRCTKQCCLLSGERLGGGQAQISRLYAVTCQLHINLQWLCYGKGRTVRRYKRRSLGTDSEALRYKQLPQALSGYQGVIPPYLPVHTYHLDAPDTADERTPFTNRERLHSTLGPYIVHSTCVLASPWDPSLHHCYNKNVHTGHKEERPTAPWLRLKNRMSPSFSA